MKNKFSNLIHIIELLQNWIFSYGVKGQSPLKSPPQGSLSISRNALESQNTSFATSLILKTLASQCVFASGFLSIGFAGYHKASDTITSPTEIIINEEYTDTAFQPGITQISDSAYLSYLFIYGYGFHPFDRSGNIKSLKLPMQRYSMDDKKQGRSGIIYLHITKDIGMSILKPNHSANTFKRSHNRNDRPSTRHNGQNHATISL
jgi:hypothetical protein